MTRSRMPAQPQTLMRLFNGGADLSGGKARCDLTRGFGEFAIVGNGRRVASTDERIMAEGEKTPRAVVRRVAQLALIHWGDELGSLLERTDLGPGILLNSARKAGSQNGLSGLGIQYDTPPRAASAEP